MNSLDTKRFHDVRCIRGHDLNASKSFSSSPVYKLIVFSTAMMMMCGSPSQASQNSLTPGCLRMHPWCRRVLERSGKTRCCLWFPYRIQGSRSSIFCAEEAFFANGHEMAIHRSNGKIQILTVRFNRGVGVPRQGTVETVDRTLLLLY